MSDFALALFALTPWTVPLSIFVILRLGRPYLSALQQMFAEAQRTGDPPWLATEKMKLAQAELELKREQMAQNERVEAAKLAAKKAVADEMLRGAR
jgi:hypothetical protein